MYRSPIMNFHVESNLRALPTDPNYFILRKRSKFTKWLMRVLKNLNILADRVEYMERVESSRVELNLLELRDFLEAEMHYFMYKSIKIERILLGRSQYEQFMRGDDLTRPIDVPYNEMTRDFMGARVQLNPYIDGVVFVPREQW